MNIYAYSMNNWNNDATNYAMTKTGNMITFSSNELPNIVEPVTLDLDLMDANARYEIILSPYSADTMIPNWGSNMKLNPFFSEFYEFKHLIRTVGNKSSIILYKTTADELFIKVETPITSNIDFEFVRYMDEMSIDKLLERYSKEENAVETYMNEFKIRKIRFDMLNKIPARQSISYLDTEVDLLLKMFEILLETDDKLSERIKTNHPEFIELFHKLNQHNLLDTRPIDSLAVSTETRKQQTRAAQQEYHDNL